MISVSIAINGTVIMARSAVNVGQGYKPGTCQYEVDDARVITHNPDDGAVALAIEMLRGIREPKRGDVIQRGGGPAISARRILLCGGFRRMNADARKL